MDFIPSILENFFWEIPPDFFRAPQQEFLRSFALGKFLQKENTPSSWVAVKLSVALLPSFWHENQPTPTAPSLSLTPAPRISPPSLAKQTFSSAPWVAPIS
jgi:hypothetical protein